MRPTSSVSAPAVVESVFKLAWKVAISMAAGTLLPATSATAIRKVWSRGPSLDERTRHSNLRRRCWRAAWRRQSLSQESARIRRQQPRLYLLGDLKIAFHYHAISNLQESARQTSAGRQRSGSRERTIGLRPSEWSTSSRRQERSRARVRPAAVRAVPESASPESPKRTGCLHSGMPSLGHASHTRRIDFLGVQVVAGAGVGANATRVAQAACLRSRAARIGRGVA